MSQNRFRRDRGFVNPSKMKKGPNGRNLCRWCQREVPPRRKTFCSGKCVHEWKLRTDPVYVRSQVYARDKGICAMCAIDTELLKRTLTALWEQSPEEAHQNCWMHGFGNAFKHVRLRWGHYPKPRSLWQADHIVPVVEGGGECDLTNYRTLCLPCHHKVSAELMGRLKDRKAAQRAK